MRWEESGKKWWHDVSSDEKSKKKILEETHDEEEVQRNPCAKLESWRKSLFSDDGIDCIVFFLPYQLLLCNKRKVTGMREKFVSLMFYSLNSILSFVSVTWTYRQWEINKKKEGIISRNRMKENKKRQLLNWASLLLSCLILFSVSISQEDESWERMREKLILQRFSSGREWGNQS